MTKCIPHYATSNLVMSAPGSRGAGPITGCALGAVRRILDQNVIGKSSLQTADHDAADPAASTLTHPGARWPCCAGVARQGTAEAMHKTAEAITQCRFEATDPASDEVVLFKILQVLHIRCSGAR